MPTQSSEALESTVLAALEVLYQPHSQPEQVQAADAYLRAFQVTPEAFNVAVALLDRFLRQAQQHPTTLPQTIPVLFFASQTLANKLRRQHALPQDAQYSFGAWCQRFVHWLAELPAQMPKMVPTQLILALMACVPRLSADEITATSVPTQFQSQQTNPTSAIGYVMGLLSSAHVSSTILAEVLIVMVEELSDVQERRVREQLQRDLDNWAITVLDQLLPQLMHDASSSQDATTQGLVLRAARAWIRYAHVNSAVVANNALMQSLLVFLRHDELFDGTVDLVVELVRRYVDLRNDLPLIQWLVPQLMQLKTDFADAARDEDTDKCLGLCRIFTELGESYMDLLLGDQQMGQTMIVDLLLDCMSYPDAEIADVTTSFWFSFLAKLEKADPRTGAQSPITLQFQSQIIRLASICMHNLQFQDDFPKLPSDKRQDFKSFRQSLGDILRDCCDALGVDSILTHCVLGLQSIFQLPDDQRRWQAVEAHLYCVRSIGRNVEQADPRVVSPSLEIIFQHLPQLATHPSIKYTACLIVSRYGIWLRDNEKFVAPLVEFLHQCVVGSAQDALAADWQVASAAATALRSLAIDCWSTLGSDLLRFYLYVEKHEAMSIDDQVLILEGVCMGVAKSRDQSAVFTVLEQVIDPLVVRLSSVFTASVNGQHVNSTVVMQELLRLICLYDYLSEDDRCARGGGHDNSGKKPLVMLTERIWAALDQVLMLFRGSDELVERVCRCYKRMLRSCEADFKPFLPSMVKNLVSFYQSEPKSSYLYAGSMVLKHFYQDRAVEIQGLLSQMLASFATATLPLFKIVDTMQSHPDIIEEFFYLMERSVRSMPQLLVHASAGGEVTSEELLAQLMVCSVAALQISHNDANKGTLCFLEQAVERSLVTAAPDVVGARMQHVLSESFVSSSGRELVDRLLRGIVLGSISRYRVDEDFGSISGVLVQLAKLNGGLLRQLIAEWFAHAQASSHLVAFLASREIHDFQEDLFSAADERGFRRVVRHFSRMCSSRTEASLLK